jgi:hypothetical protein
LDLDNSDSTICTHERIGTDKSNLPGKARRISLQIALTVHDTNFAVGPDDPMLCVYAHFALNGFGSFPKHEFAILGMDRFPNCRQFNGTFLRVQSVDPVRLT